MSTRYKHQRQHNDAYDNFEKIRHKRTNEQPRRSGKAARAMEERNHEFKCANCGAMVSLNREVSGVNNRNHCPYCLWSRHLDRNKAGDRLSACRSRMEPLGLTVKHTLKRYNAQKQGELMIIPRCAACGKFSINRIAGDDNTVLLNELFVQSQHMPQAMLERLGAQGILPLGARDVTLVQSQLFGWQSILAEFESEAEVYTPAVKFISQDQ